MEFLKIAQYYSNSSASKEKRREFVKNVNVNYCIPDTLPDKQQIYEWAGNTSLHFAVRSHDFDLTVELLNQGANVVKQGTKDGCTPLHLAVDNSDVYISFGKIQEYELINTLLMKQVETNEILNPKCKNGVSHLHIACMVNHAQAVELFVKAKVPLDQPIESALQGFTPLHCAIQYSAVKAASILVEHGADVHIQNSKQMSCLHLLVQRILDMNDYITMGHRTLCLPYEEEVERLESIIKSVLNGSNQIFVDDTGLSAFHVACTLRDKLIIGHYLKRGANVNQPVKSGSKFWPAWTPLHFAASVSIEIMIFLIESGANVLMRNLKGETPLDLCAKRFTPRDIQLILLMEDKLRDIILSDNSTKFSDLLLAMNDFDSFSNFVKKLKNIKIIIPLTSPIWPGYNLLHLSVTLKERTKYIRFSQDFEEMETKESIERYNCTSEEIDLYGQRIELCLKYGCSVDVTNANGQTSIHLAFDMKSAATVEKLLSYSQLDVVDQNGLSHLHIACALRNLDAVRRYTSQGANVNSRVRTSFDWELGPKQGSIDVKPNSTPLHIAVLSGNRDIIQRLLENGADVYARDSLGRTPIHSSGSVCWISIANLLFKATPNLRDCASADNLSHLHVAAWADDREAVEKLLLNGAEVDRVAETEDAESSSSWTLSSAGKTALLVALDKKANEVVDSLLKAGANVHAKDREGVSALQHALRDMSSSTAEPFVRLAKSRKLDVESCGMTLLHVACGTFDLEWAEELLESGADVNARVRGKGKLQGATPLYVLVDKTKFSDNSLHRQFARFVKLLMDHGADVTMDCCRTTPLHLIYKAIYFDPWDEVEIDEMTMVLRVADLMLKSQKSYDVNPTDDDGVSHFHLASIRNDLETVTKFLDHGGVDVNASIDPFVDHNGGFTPLHFTMTYQCKEVACLLLKKGANVKAEDVKANTPLHIALKNNFVDFPLFEAMIRRGVDIHAKNVNDETLLYCLMGYGGLTLDALRFFLNRGCSINILDATNESNEGILGLAMRSAPPTELQPILEQLVQFPEVKRAIAGGFDTLKSIVSIKENDELTLDDYLRAIEFFVKIGRSLDQTDTHGVTTLHVAASYYNIEAVNALLQLGADINAIDNNKYDCPFFDEFVAEDHEFEEDYDETGDMKVSKALARHAWKMRFNGLELKEPILRRLEKVEEEYSLIVLLEQSCQDELAKARESKICQGLTVKDFLSELGAVAEYPRMGSVRRAFVDNYFKCAVNLRREFPRFCGLLALQYRKALARMCMWHPAKDAITLICRIELPDLCIETILRYFTNSETKLLIELVKELA